MKTVEIDVLGVLRYNEDDGPKEIWLLSTFDNVTYFAYAPHLKKFQVVKVRHTIETLPETPKYDLSLKDYPNVRQSTHQQ